MKAVVLLRRWATLGRTMSASAPAVDWTPASDMISAAERDAAASQVVLHRLLETSKRRKFPRLGDPLDGTLDFDSHRWLRREESWSDWLAWILERNGKNRDVAKLFGLKPTLVGVGICEVERECSTQQYGRPDLVLRFGDATLVVEVKTASQAGDQQLDLYGAWLKRTRASLGLVLLAIDEPMNLTTTGLRFCSWERVSMGLRTWAAAWLRAGRLIEATLTLAFCGAIEQNLLGFGSSLNAPRTARYLETWLQRNKK